MATWHQQIRACNGLIHFVKDIAHIPKRTIWQLLDHSKLSVFKIAIQTAGLQHLFNRNTSYTILAPSNRAFWKNSIQTLTDLFYDKKKLRELLKYHIIPRTYFTCAISWRTYLRALNGKRVRLKRVQFSSEVKKYTANYANLEEVDIGATDGAIHILDEVLLYMSLGST